MFTKLSYCQAWVGTKPEHYGINNSIDPKKSGEPNSKY